MADDKIKLSIELEEGSVKKSFDNIRAESKNTAKDIEKNFGSSTASMVEGLGKVSLAITGVAAAAYAIKKAFDVAIDFALMGEKVSAINKQFEIIASSAGLTADVLRNDLVKSLDGLIDDEDALQMATKSIVSLGSAASELPKLFDNARSASRALGTDFKNTAESFAMFVETGNAKALRQYGIVLDTSKAFEKYAKSIGLAANQLNIAQEQQIRMNLLLENTSKKFAGTSESITPLADSIQRLKVSIGDANDAFGEFVKRNYGDVFAMMANGFSDFIKSASGTTTVQDKVRQLNDQIDKTQQRINAMTFAKFEREGKTGLASFFQVFKDGEGVTSTLNLNLTKSKEIIAGLKAQLADITKSTEASKKELSDKKPMSPDGVSEDQSKIILANRKKAETELNAFLLSKNQERLQFRQQEIAGIEDLNARKVQTELVSNMQLDLIDQQYRQKLLEVSAQFSLDKGFTLEQQKQAELAVTQSYNDQLINAEQDRADKIEKIDKESQTKRLKLATELASTLKNTLVSGTSQTLQAFGEKLAKGDALFSDFGASIIGVVGDMAISLGQGLIAQGIGLEAFITALNTLLPGAGFAAAAAGAALVIFGGALKASVGKGGGGGAAAPSSAGGSSGGASDVSTQPVDIVESVQRPEASTTVAINIQGDVLDSEETGLRIVDILNSAFDKQGVIVKKGVLA